MAEGIDRRSTVDGGVDVALPLVFALDDALDEPDVVELDEVDELARPLTIAPDVTVPLVSELLLPRPLLPLLLLDVGASVAGFLSNTLPGLGLSLVTVASDLSESVSGAGFVDGVDGKAVLALVAAEVDV